jgi:hypothetical protein
MTRQATVLVCDDLLISLNGKLTVVGMYTGDILVPSESPLSLPQLVFLFVIEGTTDSPLRSLTLEVRLPGDDPKQNLIPIPVTGIQVDRGRKRWILNMPFPISPALLRPGRIEARVIHEEGEISVRAPWIVTPSRASPTAP